MVRTKNTALAHRDIANLDQDVTFVHIAGHPFLWAIEEILRAAPNLLTLQVIPTRYQALNPETHLRLCAARGVSVVKGHHRPEVAWDTARVIGPEYRRNRAFLMSLGPEARAAFGELIELGFEEAEMAHRYFCIGDQPFVPMRDIAEHFGISPRNYASQVSAKLYAVLRYLDPTLPVNRGSARRAAVMARRAEQLRRYLASAAAREEIARSIGMPAFPDGLRPVHYDRLKDLVACIRDGRMARLAAEYPRKYRALALRYGLEGWTEGVAPGRHMPLVEVGAVLGVTRERVRQLEEWALRYLEIADDESSRDSDTSEPPEVLAHLRDRSPQP